MAATGATREGDTQAACRFLHTPMLGYFSQTIAEAAKKIRLFHVPPLPSLIISKDEATFCCPPPSYSLGGYRRGWSWDVLVQHWDALQGPGWLVFPFLLFLGCREAGQGGTSAASHGGVN